MVTFNIEELLKKHGKSKYWLCKNMNITFHNLNRIIYGETNAISFRYLEDMCKYLDCEIGELISFDDDIEK
ncbi:MAG: helix-turn-helix transcriptional regulator [Clostridia bacterium]|nr:helix-turn-helix transcriptional regulator [Clostridia bacterium]